MRQKAAWFGTIVGVLAVTACGGGGASGSAASAENSSKESAVSPVPDGGRDPDLDLEAAGRRGGGGSPVPTPTPTAPVVSGTPTALIFNGAGTSATDTQSLASIAQSHGLTYRIVVSSDLESMTLNELSAYRLIIWPGGDSNVMTSGLSAATREKIREAVVNRGVNYVGFCAGAWMAVGPALPAGVNPYWGLSIVNAAYLKQYYPNGLNPVAAMVPISFSDGSSRSLVWWGGPYLPSLAGSVIGKYPDGSAAILEAQAGAGFVVLSGPHPEAPQSWRDGVGLTDSDGLDFTLTWNLIQSALNRSRLATY